MMMGVSLSLVRVMMMTLTTTSSSSNLLVVSRLGEVSRMMMIGVRTDGGDTGVVSVTEFLVLVVVLPAGDHQTVHRPAPVHLHLQHPVKLPVHAHLGVGEHAEHHGDGE